MKAQDPQRILSHTILFILPLFSNQKILLPFFSLLATRKVSRGKKKPILGKPQPLERAASCQVWSYTQENFKISKKNLKKMSGNCRLGRNSL